MLDAVADVRGVGGDRVEDPLADLGASRLPIALGEVVRDVLGEDAHRVAPRRGDRGVVGGLEVELGEPDRGLTAPTRLSRLLSGVEPLGDRDHRAVRVHPTCRREGGQLVQPGIQLHNWRLHPPGFDSPAIGSRHRAVVQHLQSPLRVGVGEHDRGAEPLPAFELHPLPRDDSAHRRAGRQRGAALQRSLGDRERNAAHPTADVSPVRAQAQQVALVVHRAAPMPSRDRAAQRTPRSRPARTARA